MKPNFTLPPFPGHVNQSVITINVICNTVSYPLLTLTIRQPNIYVPTFYNTPYSMHIPHHTSPQQQIETSILAIDWDPVKKYSVTFSIISGNEGNVFEIGFSNATYFNRKFLPTTTKDGKAVPQRWSHSQLPPIVNLILLQPLQLSQYNLVVQASDNANPPSTATTSLVVYVDMANDLIPIFEKEHYFVNYTLNTKAGDVLMEGGVIVASFDANRIDSNETILYVLEETDVGDLLDLNPLTAAIHAKQDFLSDKVGGQMKVNIRSYSELNPNRYHTSQIVLNENIENVGAHFSPCNVEVSVKENAAVGTLLTRLNVLGTFSSLRLSDNGAVFKILDDGSIVVSDSTFLDREKVANLHLIAQIIHTKGSAEGLKGSPCQRAKINVTLIDENDNAPQFSLPSYYFALPNIPRNNSEIGTIRATDPDEGMNSELEYDFDQEPPSDWPFDLIYKEDGVALIFIQQKNQRQIIERKYTFQIKANDISDEPRIGRVNVTVDFDSKVDGNDEEDVDMPNHSLLSPIPTQTKPNPTHFSMFDEDAEMSSIDGDVTKVHKDQSIQLPMKRHFEVEKYVFDLHSAIDVAQFVGTIKVVDGHPNEIFEYDLEINTPNIFEINSGTGDIFVGRRLLQMEHDGIEFVFEATATLNHLKVVSFCFDKMSFKED
uniref:Cadherin domain-containing protein n=1 Tax=Rhabditophanes sp. KR3021 TaxID=114890 RepID=A0AC35TWF2_9BILA